MGVVTGGGGGGGAAFNGGKITTPLEIDAPATVLSSQLLIDSDLNGTADALVVSDAVASTIMSVGNNGLLFLRSPSRTSKVLYVDGAAHVSGDDDILFVTADAIPLAAIRVSGAGDFIIQGHNAAPADADLHSKECALWFDSTNGAAKLMVKAKSANGTVVTGSLALA